MTTCLCIVFVNAGNVATPVTLTIYYDCLARLNCTTPIVERTIAMPEADYTGEHTDDRALLLNAGGTYTYNQGRLVVSESRSVLTLGGYAANFAGWNLLTAVQKVEPITFSLYQNGFYNISTGCKVRPSHCLIVVSLACLVVRALVLNTVIPALVTMHWCCFNTTGTCLQIWSQGYRAIYCNGFDDNEIPQAIATTDGSEFWISGGEELPR